MSSASKIEWTEVTWNPTTGCDRISAGCDHCYALTLAKRLKAMGQAKYQNDGDPRTSGPGFGLTLHPDALQLPYSWSGHRTVFVNSMSDFSVGVKCPVLAFPLVRTHAFPVSCPRHVSRTRPRRHPSRNRMAVCRSAGPRSRREVGMSDITKIEWTDHTFNPWWGCSRVSPACRFCYADRDARRDGHELWRRHGERRMLSERNWKRPLKWNRDAGRNGVPEKVFCASMADVFEAGPSRAGGAPQAAVGPGRGHALAAVAAADEAAGERGRDGAVGQRLAVVGLARGSAPRTSGGRTRGYRSCLICLPARSSSAPSRCSVRSTSGSTTSAATRRTTRARPMADWLIIGGESGGRARANADGVGRFPAGPVPRV